MIYCLNSRQPAKYLQKVDEIKIEYRDRDSIPDLCEKYPDKTFILMHDKIAGDSELDWDKIKKWNILAHNRLVLSTTSIAECKQAKENKIYFFMPYPVSSWSEATALKDLGVLYLVVGAPLFFDMEGMKMLNIPLRIIPNVTSLDGLPRENGVNGIWVRPENIDDYEPYITSVEFICESLQKEKALYRIYAEQKEWPGELEKIISGLNHPALNRLINPEVTAARLNCRQTCASPRGTCGLCYRALELAQIIKQENAEMLKTIKKD